MNKIITNQKKTEIPLIISELFESKLFDSPKSKKILDINLSRYMRKCIRLNELGTRSMMKHKIILLPKRIPKEIDSVIIELIENINEETEDVLEFVNIDDDGNIYLLGIGEESALKFLLEGLLLSPTNCEFELPIKDYHINKYETITCYEFMIDSDDIFLKLRYK